MPTVTYMGNATITATEPSHNQRKTEPADPRLTPTSADPELDGRDHQDQDQQQHGQSGGRAEIGQASPNARWYSRYTKVVV